MLIAAFVIAIQTLTLVTDAVPLPTFEKDKLALLAFKAGIFDPKGVLSSWTLETDPCIDGWFGISCSCNSALNSSTINSSQALCAPLSGASSGYSRILQIELSEAGTELAGNLSATLGTLTELRVMNLKNNNFSGSIPSKWRSLRHLEQLFLSNNSISGVLPTWLQKISTLKYVFLDQNQFSGPLPLDWCSPGLGSWWPFDVRSNPALCGMVPTCLANRIISLDGTSLIDPYSKSVTENGGHCGVPPLHCSQENGCSVQGPSPPYWTNLTHVTFSFTEFSTVSKVGKPISYDWKLGTYPGGGDVVNWVPYQGHTVTQDVEVSSKTGQLVVISQVVHVAHGSLPTGIALRQGAQYYVAVRGYNKAGPLQGLTIVSQAVSVDSTPPEQAAGGAVYNTQFFSDISYQNDTHGIGFSWDEFNDPESGLVQYAYQVFEYVLPDPLGPYSGVHAGNALINKLTLRPTAPRSIYISKLNLQRGKSYFVRLYARNGAGLESVKDSPPVTIRGKTVTGTSFHGNAFPTTTIVVSVFVGIACAVVPALGFLFAKERYRRSQQLARKRRNQSRNLRNFLRSLTSRDGKAQGRISHLEDEDGEEMETKESWVFVITDLESSTEIAQAFPRAFEWVQEAHDSTIRDLILAFDGYEINTEGDAFHVAFGDAATAVQFAMEVQYQMMELEWPQEILRMPKCREVKTADGQLAFRGPRVRIGIHWAEEGSVEHHIHNLTKHRVFSGSAFQVTRDLCETAAGGQVLLTQPVWDRLRHRMHVAAFPVVEQMGLLKYPRYSEELWVYRVARLLGKPLPREDKSDLRFTSGASLLQKGNGFYISPPPKPRDPTGTLTFVSCRFALESCIPGLRGEQVPLILFIRLYELLASVTMQFEGFIYRFVERRGQYLVVFSSPKDAICFCHATQMLLMQELWPSEAVSWCGDIEKTADDKLLYKGPRLAMVVHNSNNYTLQHQKSNFLEDDLLSGRLLQSRRDIFVDYVGSVEQEMKILSEIAHGGQVILTEAAWQAAQDQLPGKPQVISLGKHQINNSLIPNPMILMEVMPHPLSKRIFPPPRNTIIMEPSYYDAPSADTDVTIVYMKVAKPMKVFEAECANAASSRLSRSEKVLEAYIKALELTMATARSLLQTFNGYECKEVEREKATFAFRNLETGVRWAASLQLELSKAEWPDEVLTWDDCRVGVNAVPRLCTGLKVHAGIACGIPSSKAPLKTGRADYYGTVPNLAARLMALSQPGQILIDGAKLSTLRGAATVTDDELILLPKCENKPFHTEALIIPIGQVAIKGLEDFRIVYHVVPSELRGTDFQEPAGLVQRTTMHSFVRRALAGRELSRSSNSLHQEGNGADFASESMSSKNDPHPNVFASLFIMEDSFTGNTVRKGRGFSLFRSTSKFSDNSDGSTTLLDSVHRLQAKEDQDSSMEAGTNRKS